jgi:putative FmdB family regulatory protein
MPVYEYLCDDCGPFTQMRPMAQYDKAQKCPECGRRAPRAILTAPHFSAMAADRRQAHATNERSANEPKLLSKTKHGSGCSCCSGSKKPSRLVNYGKNGAKSFPTSRPWMISH